MKILWVKAGGLLPPDTGGKIRSFHILRELSRKHQVTFFTFYPAHNDDTHRELERVFERVVLCPLEIPASKTFADLLRYARNLFAGQPHAVGRYYHHRAAENLRKLVERESFNALVCDFIVAGSVIPWEIDCPKILFAHNVEALIWKRHYQVTHNPLWKAVCWREYRSMTRVERAYVQRADHVLTVSESDRVFFTRYVDSTKITTIPTGVDADYFRPLPSEEESNALVFTGSMDWSPNEDAILYFVHEVLPHIRRQFPDITVWVVGRHPSPRLRALEVKDSGVKVTGWVEDVRPYIRDASVYFVPLRIGGGTRLKIFEAMAMGKAIVSTSVGAEGLPVRQGENILIADEPLEFADKVVKLLRDPAGRAELGLAARQLVEQKYSWQSVAAQVDQILGSLVDRNTRVLCNA